MCPLFSSAVLGSAMSCSNPLWFGMSICTVCRKLLRARLLAGHGTGRASGTQAVCSRVRGACGAGRRRRGRLWYVAAWMGLPFPVAINWGPPVFMRCGKQPSLRVEPDNAVLASQRNARLDRALIVLDSDLSVRGRALSPYPGPIPCADSLELGPRARPGPPHPSSARGRGQPFRRGSQRERREVCCGVPSRGDAFPERAVP
jgi:hypothetical protein